MRQMISLADIMYMINSLFSSRLSSVRRYRFRLNETFWSVREKRTSLRFWYLNHIYQIRNWFSSKSHASRVLFSISTSIMKQTILLFLLILLIMGFDRNMVAIQPGIESSLPENIRAIIPRITLKTDAYLNLLGVLAQLSGG